MVTHIIQLYLKDSRENLHLVGTLLAADVFNSTVDMELIETISSDGITTLKYLLSGKWEA